MVYIIISIITALILIFGVIDFIDVNRFIIKEYSFTSPKITKDATFVVLSDLHNKCFGKDNQKLLRAIDQIHPDVVLMTGDMITSQTVSSCEETKRFIIKLAEKYKIVYANGNHEQRMSEFPRKFGAQYYDYKNALKDAGVNPYVNEALSLTDYGIDIYGLEIEHRFFYKFKRKDMPDDYVQKLLGSRKDNKYNIVLAHNPDYFDKYEKWKPDLVLSGHIHGGAIRIPGIGGVISPTYTLFPRYDGGKFTINQSVMILSRGLGTHTIPVRIFNPGELIVLHMNKPRR